VSLFRTYTPILAALVRSSTGDYLGLLANLAAPPVAVRELANGRACTPIAVAVLCLALAGCETDGRSWSAWSSSPAFNALTATVQEADDVKYFPSDEPLKLGLEHFNRANYGVAERYFRESVEKAPRDATAWLGLAATYDRIARFDLADRAYRSAIELTGETTQVLNNQGYSYMLRGDLTTARQKFMKAYQREPNNPTVANNLKLLNSSERFIQRVADPREAAPQ
jgi:Tfp pilus assembly protein PilF